MNEQEKELLNIAFKNKRTIGCIKYDIDNYNMCLEQAFIFELEPKCSLLKKPIKNINERKELCKRAFKIVENNLKKVLTIK